MEKQASIFQKTLPIALFPPIVAGTSFLVEKLFSLCLPQNSGIHHQSGVGLLQDFSQKESEENAITMILLVLQQLRGFILSIYDNYLTFLGFMMVLRLVIYLFKNYAKNILKRDCDIESLPKTTEKMRMRTLLRNLFISLLYYTLSFCIFKFLMLLVMPAGLTIAASKELIAMKGSQMMLTSPTNQLFRRLDEDDDADGESPYGDRMLVSQKPLFIKVINETYVDNVVPLQVVFTRDFQLIFEAQAIGLAVYSISDLMVPRKIGFFAKDTIYLPSLVLSPSSKTIFMDTDSLHIIDVTDVKNPTLLSQISFRTEQDLERGFRYHPTVAVSPDEKYIISSDPRMAIYDISDLHAPKLIFDQSWASTAVLLSKDGSTAYIGSEGSLEIWDVRDFTAPKHLSSLKVLGTVLTSVLSNDGQTIYLLGYATMQAEQTPQFFLHVINIQDPANPFAQVQLGLGASRDFEMTGLTVSADGTFLIFKSSLILGIINLRDLTVVNLMDDGLKCPHLAFLPNGKNAVIFSVGLVRLAEVYFNIQYDQSTSLQPNIAAQIPLQGGLVPKQIVFSELEKTAFILANDASDPNHKVLLSLDLSDYYRPKVVENLKLQSASLFTLSANGKNIYYKYQDKVLKAYNNVQGKISEAFAITFDINFEQPFIVSSDQKTVVTLTLNDADYSSIISIYDISNLSAIMLKMRFTLQTNSPRYYFDPEGSYLMLSPDEKTLFYLNYKLYIIDISNKAGPKLLSNLNFYANITKTFAFTSDFKTCFLIAGGFLDKKALMTVDLRDYSHPVLVSITDLPYDTILKLSVSSDDKILFVGTSEAFISLDISNKKAIKILEAQQMKISGWAPIYNDEEILVGNANDGFEIFARKPLYALYLSEHQFPLGRTYSNSLKLLEMNQKSTNYSSIGENYKFIQASLYVSEIKPLSKLVISYPILPNWMYFDKENAVLDLELNQQVNVASYQIRFCISSEVSAKDFVQIKGVNFTQVEAQNLLAYLAGQGYLDPEKFLTSHFDVNTPLLLNSQYSEYEQEIRQILKTHSIELITKISVESSLKLVQSKPFQITTPSSNPIHMTLKLATHLEKSKQTKFVTKAFPAVKVNLDEDKVLLILEGASLNVNEALKDLLINIEDGGTCEGTVIISDGLNPTQTFDFERLSDFIETNKKPQMVEAFSIQDQIEGVSFIAGEHFSVEFDERTFMDLNKRPLAYSLEMPENDMEVPGWITLRGRTLMGTPPEEFWPYSKNFCLVASNEYKSEEIIFTLKIRLSYVTIMRRVLFVVGYLFTSYKFWQHSDKAYNILCKKRYRYLRTVAVAGGTGKELSKRHIFPIILISKQMRMLRQGMLKNLREYLGQGQAFNDQQLFEYFVDGGSHRLNRERLTETIENMALQDRGENPTRVIFEYQNKDRFHRELVQDLIANEITMKRIGSEKPTLKIFEDIKSQWIDLVDIDVESSRFFINNQALAHVLSIHGISTKETNTEDSWNQKDDESGVLSTKRSIEKELILSPISGSKINLGLLKDAILAFAFKQQNIYRSRYNVRVQSKELMNNNLWAKNRWSWRRFLKLDMIGLVENSMKQLGYGLKYEFIENHMVFYGKPKEQINNKTIVVQIVTKGGWILREILIQGENSTTAQRNLLSSIESIQEEL